jgi:hypothetical protein
MNRTARAAGIIGRNPRETVGLIAASAAILMIFVNALFLQPGPHPAPIFASRLPGRIAATAPVPFPPPAPVSDMTPWPRSPAVSETQHAKAAVKAVPEPSHTDPIAQLLGPSKQVLAVQRVLTAYGYGQIRPTGMIGPETQDAIKKFERSRKMPVTGTISDQLVRSLADMSGQPLD